MLLNYRFRVVNSSGVDDLCPLVSRDRVDASKCRFRVVFNCQRVRTKSTQDTFNAQYSLEANKRYSKF